MSLKKLVERRDIIPGQQAFIAYYRNDLE